MKTHPQEGKKALFSTFKVAGRLYGIDVTRVQEITKAMPCTRVPLAPPHVLGLINLRGQIATAIDLKKLFELHSPQTENSLSIFCEMKGLLLSLTVDEIGDVVEVEPEQFESPPDTIPGKIRSLMGGVYKIPGDLLSILEIEKIMDVVQNNGKPTERSEH